MRTPVPPRFAEWLLRLMLPDSHAGFVCDDVAERYAREIVPVRGRAGAWLWYWGEVMRSVVPAFRLRRMARGGSGQAKSSGGFGWLQDLRYAWRGLARNPGWTVMAAGILALGIGGTTAMYGAVRALLLRPLPFGGESRIVAFSSSGDWSGPEFLAVREWRGPFEAVAAAEGVDWTYRVGRSESGVVSGLQSTAGLFDVLGVAAERGRTFRAEDDVPGAEPVVVLSHSMWARELGSDPAVVGRPIVLDGVSRTVVGVMPEGFFFPTPDVRFWAAMPMAADLWDYGLLGLIGRVDPGVSVAAAGSTMPALGALLRDRFEYDSSWDKTNGLVIEPIRNLIVGEAGRPLAFLLGAVAVLLLIACANVSALVLGRALDRGGEYAVRSALGAGRTRLVFQSFAEGLVLAVPGGIAGGVAGAAGFRLLRDWLPVSAAWRDALTADWTLPLAALGLALVASAVTGMVAVRAVGSAGIESTLRRAGRTGRGGSGRLLQALVVAEIALTIVLVASAASLVQSISNLRSRDAGVDAEDVLAVDVAVGAGDFDEAGRHAAFQRVVDAVRAIPGATSVGLTQRLPFRDGGWGGPVWAEERPDDRGPPGTLWRHVTPGYFDALGMTVRGRTFLETDDERAPGVVVVSRSLAAALWPGTSPIGRGMRTGITPAGQWLTVVGVVDDVPVLGLGDEVRPVVYVPWAQAGVTMESNTLLLRSPVGADAASAVRAAVRSAEPRVTIAGMQTLESVMRESIAEPRQVTLFLNIFGALALLLGAVGVYGVLANFVRGRLFEFGIRLALGSTPSAVVGRVVVRAVSLVGTGLIIGLPLAVAASRTYSIFLYDIAPGDVTALATSALVLLATGVVAAWIPCVRASRADPVSLLRSD